jgi:hypothetical protein
VDDGQARNLGHRRHGHSARSTNRTSVRGGTRYNEWKNRAMDAGLRDVETVPLRRVRAHLVLGQELSLIDCGYARSLPRIVAALAGHGRTVEDLARVVCTHGHPTTPAERARLEAAVAAL